MIWARSFRDLAALTLVVVMVVSGGCKPKKYAVSTRIDSGGEFDREILQPLDDSMPPEALVIPKTALPNSQPSDYALKPAWQKAWRQCATRPATPDTEGTYVSARGHFAVVDEIPRTYHLVAYPFSDRVASNKVNHAFDNYLLFGVDSWNETLTETISLPDYVEAVDEMLGQMFPAIGATLAELLGDEYDLTALHGYLGGDLRKAIRHLHLWCYENGPGIAADGLSGAPVDELRQILAGAGLKLPMTGDGASVDQERLSAAWEPFVRERIRRLVRFKASGSALSEGQIQALMDRFGLFSENKTPAATHPAGPPQSDGQAAIWHAFLGHFERLSKVSYDQARARWEARIGGAHRVNPLIQGSLHELSGSRHYAFTFVAGGPILETDGQRVAEDQVQWHFTDLDIWPHGYAMQVTAVRWNREAEKKLFGRIVLGDLDTVLHLRDLIADHDDVYDALAQAIEQGSLRPIKTLSESKEPVNREAAKTILDLKSKR
ncbi:MAG TPA: hypothetical protein PKY77_06400 [Phycisphaerae bacterium]|nr:hypothetical protein [Phycisphaerae bacterium]HRY69513.1 hypothetical protein [Phycisphaerae bacterium]HSA28183.1 hypothetical protein [Phycisphaerae bacterium]